MPKKCTNFRCKNFPNFFRPFSIPALFLVFALVSCDPPKSPKFAAPPKWVHIAAGSQHTLAIYNKGQLYAWGNNAFGQLGNGKNSPGTGLNRLGNPDTSEDKDTPQRIGSDSWKAVTSGTYFSLGIKSDGTLYAWGSQPIWATGP